MDVETGRRRAGVALVGLILLVVGIVWAGQGVGWIGGSFMTGRSSWLAIGIVVAGVGIALIAWGRRRAPQTPHGRQAD